MFGGGFFGFGHVWEVVGWGEGMRAEMLGVGFCRW